MIKRLVVSITVCMLVVPHVVFGVSIHDDWNILLNRYPKFDAQKQAVCVTDAEGKILFSQNENMPVVPASVSKVYTTDFVLSHMDKNYRFITDAYINKGVLYINGDSDPFLLDSHMKLLFQKIAQDNKVGTIKKIVYNNMYLNWSTTSFATTKELRKVLFREPVVSKYVTITTSTSPYRGPGTMYRFTSKPLVSSLKQMNIYSTNSASELLFARLGGRKAFQAYMLKTYGADTDVVSFHTGSGLEDNITTCALTLKVMRHLGETLAKNELTFNDILPTPIIDGGSMRNRMKNILDPKVLLVKPGFVYHHETLTGVLHTLSGNIYFGIFTEYDDVKAVTPPRVFIDTFTEKLIAQYQAIPFVYFGKAFVQTDGVSVVRVR